MPTYTISQLCSITQATMVGQYGDTLAVEKVYTDSRTIADHGLASAIFIALSGKHRSGEAFVSDAYNQGVRIFLVSRLPKVTPSDTVFLVVKDTLEALCTWAAYHRSQFDIPVIGITGSNGKTTVKEWLAELLAPHYEVVKSPKSYNSLLGVALSVLQMDTHHTIAIFEAGVGELGTMEIIAKMIQPTIGVFTMLGDAHEALYPSRLAKLKEKCRLFTHADTVVFPLDQEEVKVYMKTQYQQKNLVSWTLKSMTEARYAYDFQDHRLVMKVSEETYEWPVTAVHAAHASNLASCISTMLHLGVEIDPIAIVKVSPLPMRLELQEGIDGSLIINDSYVSDFHSLEIALTFIQAYPSDKPRWLVLSTIDQSNVDEAVMLSRLSQMIESYQLDGMITVGSALQRLQLPSHVSHIHFNDTEALMQSYTKVDWSDKLILIKGSRNAHLEDLANRLYLKSHSAVLKVDLNAIGHNLNVYRSYLKEGQEVMAVIKASAYGSGSADIARYLVSRGVSLIAVALADEGIALRQAGIQVPILVLNPDFSQLYLYQDYQLDLEVYNIYSLERIASWLDNNPHHHLSLHIKLDTGMHRLGFVRDESAMLLQWLEQHKHQITLKSIFSHLVASDDPAFDEVTLRQIEAFETWIKILPKAEFYHLANTAAIQRFDLPYGVVRLGLGLYGIDTSASIGHQLYKAHTLEASILQVKPVKKGEGVGYSHRYIAEEDIVVAIVNIGYADGLLRGSGNGRFSILHKGQPLTIIGNVCMDLTICRVDHSLGIAVGDKVEVFGPTNPIETLATINHTIPYEILSRIAPRVRRLYYID